jgi:hypothetical protein
MTDPAILRQARIDLAAALRWGDRHGFGEAIGNHFSFMVPGAQYPIAGATKGTYSGEGPVHRWPGGLDPAALVAHLYLPAVGLFPGELDSAAAGRYRYGT